MNKKNIDKETIETLLSGPKCLHSFVESFDIVSFALVRLAEDALKCFSAVP